MIEDLNTMNEKNKQVQIRNCQSMRKFLVHALDSKLLDKELIQNLRSQAKDFINNLDSLIKSLQK
jgi:hypothetical protein